MIHPRRMTLSALTVTLFLFAALAILSGCAAWQPHWPDDAVPAEPPDAGRLLQEADRLASRAVDKESLQAAMEAYGRVLERAPYHTRALTELASQTILMGTAHTQDRQGKDAHFFRAMRLCERAMYADPDFRDLVNQDMTPWEACHVLDARFLPAMMFWSTAVLYRFKEVLTFPEQVVNLAWVEHTGPFLDRMEALDPAWGGGAVQFTRSLYLGILPGALGGDDERSGQLLEEAVAFGAPWMLSRWGRARYFHVRDGNRQGFEEDLRWVLAQDVAVPAEAFCWRAYFHRDAREALGNVDDYF
jgi:hypothetical protein